VVTAAIWAGAVVVIITDGVEAEDIITVGGTAATEKSFVIFKGPPQLGGVFINWACDVFHCQ